MKIFGKDFKKHELLKRIGDISQLGGVKYYEYIDGAAKGLRAMDIKTPQGMDMTVLLDRAMDISSFSYKGIPLAWRSSTKETSAIYYDSRGFEWLRSFYGGLLTTCGLENFGPPCRDGDEEFGLHGRISNLPAEGIALEENWQDDSYQMILTGRVRESKVFGDKLELTRKIITSMDSNKVIIEDIVTNIGFKESPFMILYHINLGFPLLEESSRLIEGPAKVTPRDKEADKGIDNYFEFSEPMPDFCEQVFFHDIRPDKNGYCNIALVNESFDIGKGIGLAIRFRKSQLPYLIQWKQTGLGEYVCGLEPANSLGSGREIERKNNRLQLLRPGESSEKRLEIEILSSNEEIHRYKQDIA